MAWGNTSSGVWAMCSMSPREEVRMAFIETSGRIAAAAALLNSNTVPCTCCGLTKAENWAEKQIADQAAAIVHRLQRLAKQLENA